MGTLNKYGHEHSGHYDPWLVQHIDFLRQELQIQTPNKHHLAIEVNAMKYRGLEEVFGICPLPSEEMVTFWVSTRHPQSYNW